MPKILAADFLKQRVVGTAPEHCIRRADYTKSTVSEAEAASYTSPSSVFIKETRRAYIYDPTSMVDRDGTRYLTPANGGRLLMVTPALTDEEVAAVIRDSSIDHSGLMSPTHVMQLSAYVSTTENPTSLHDDIDTAGEGRPFHVGQLWFNSDSEILWQCLCDLTGAAVWEIENLDIQEQEYFAANISTLDYWRFYQYGNGRITRDSTIGGMSYVFSGMAYAGSDGLGTQAVGIADQVVAVNITFDQINITGDIYCCEGYIFSTTSGSAVVSLYKGGNKVNSIASETMGVALSVGTHELMIVRRGSKVIGYIDGVKVVSVVDTTHQGGDSRVELNVTVDGSYSAKINSYKLFQYRSSHTNSAYSQINLTPQVPIVKGFGLMGTCGLKLRPDATTPSSKISILASSVVMRGSDGNTYVKDDVSLIVNIGVNGVNGLDVGGGTSGEKYFIWLIYNPVSDTIGGLFSVSSTSPTLPDGYTAKLLVSMVSTNAYGGFIIQYQNGRRVTYSKRQLIVSGLLSTTFTTLDLSSAIIPISEGVVSRWLPGATSSLTNTTVRFSYNGTNNISIFYSGSLNTGEGAVNEYFMPDAANPQFIDDVGVLYYRLGYSTATTLYVMAWEIIGNIN